MKRRSFFSSLARAAAIVALAPQLAFRRIPEVPVAPVAPSLDECFQMMWAISKDSAETIDILTDRATAEAIQGAMIRYYPGLMNDLLTKARQSGNPPT